MAFEYKVKGIIHAGLVNPWKVNKEGVFEKPTEELNELAKKGWEVVAVFPAGNNDRAVYILKRNKDN
ncbi:DUF4177 domain-containing protein [Candidatus Pacearchaeota archaeon]|nr:DUF4177 domain-containing protein [Candidatus Pacearchaeota archaeon]